MMDRIITRVLPAEHVVDDGDMRLLRALPQQQQIAVGPFVFLDHYRHQGRRGIGDRPHPHAGIEVVSYLLEGGVEHRDSMGSHDRLVAGDAQFIRAGRGMIHAEQPLSGRHGLQLWASLPPELKLVEPSYASIRAADIPCVDGVGSRLSVVAGDVNGVHGPMGLSGGAVFARLQLQPDAASTLAVDPSVELGLYVLQGQIEVGEVRLSAGELGVLGSGAQIRITAPGTETTELALVGGRPVQGEVLFSGPFVMDTPERLAQAKCDFAAGRMGRLEGVPY
jgi:redox-sensitive bicupin YhaK (pirin superfamily)